MFPPEFNSARMYAGQGSGSMLAAAAAWNGLAAELEMAASSYQSVVSGLTAGPWLGPSSIAMAGAAAIYVGWMHATAAQAAETGGHAMMAASAFEAAHAATVPPPVIAANRALLMALVATNFLGQNTPAIMATEAHYMEMWAQDAAAMFTYAATSAAITAKVTPWLPATQNTNLGGLAAQHAAAAGAAVGAAGTHAQTIAMGSQVLSAVPQALQSAASPAASSSSGTGVLGGLLSSSMAQSLLLQWANPATLSLLIYPATYGLMLPTQMMGTFWQMAHTGVAAPIVGGIGANAAKPLQLMLPRLGGLGPSAAPAVAAGMGQANSLGALSVPQSWTAATTVPAPMLGGVPLASPSALAATEFGAGSGYPMLFGGLPRAAAAGAGGTGGSKYGARASSVVARPPAAGYPPLPESPPTPAAGLPPAVPGYRPAIVYLPTNGHAQLPTNGHAPVDALADV